jgi:cell cycle serine/threonine-protein kinase CDC5/MSD2
VSDAHFVANSFLSYPVAEQRPNLRDVLEHPFFTYGTVPAKIPSTSHDIPPDFRHITPNVSRSNLAKLKKFALIDEADQISNSLVEPSTSEAPGSLSTAPSGADISGKVRTVPAPASSGALAQQEREFQKAVQPGSPISVLLKSAQQPLLTASASAGVRNDSASLIKKLAATKIDDARTRNGLRDIAEAPESGGEGEPPEGFENGLAPGLRSPRDTQRMRAVDNQKARLLAQMASAGATDEREVKIKEKGKGKSSEGGGSSSRVASKKAAPSAPVHRAAEPTCESFVRRLDWFVDRCCYSRRSLGPFFWQQESYYWDKSELV